MYADVENRVALICKLSASAVADAFRILSYLKLFNVNRARTISVKQIERLSDLLLLFLRQFLSRSCFLSLNCACTGLSEARCLNARGK